MMNNRHAIWFVLIVSFLCNCGRDKSRTVTEEDFQKTKEALVGANRILVKKDQERIKSFIERKGWEMKETQTGLWYQIYHDGNGDLAQPGMMISLAYTVSLLDGSLCYDSDSLGCKNFKIGQGGVESGLEEGVLLLREGDQARFIMPPHLAHGLTGDGNAIPPRSIILYDVEVVSLDTLINGLSQQKESH